MENQGIILPNASLCLVDRSWKSSRNITQPTTSEVTRPNKVHKEVYGGSIKTISQPWAPQVLQTGKAQERGDSNRYLGKSFEFVNASQPCHSKDPEVRKLVKSHVKSGVKRGPNARKKLPQELEIQLEFSDKKLTSDLHSKIGDLIAPSLNRAVPGVSMAFYGNKVSSLLVGPRSQSLLNYYLYVIAPDWYPLEAHLAYNPVRAGWFPLALRDEFLFRSILFASAASLASASGRRDHEEPTALVMPIFRQLNQRIQTDSLHSDTTIAIVSCLAMVEILRGNYSKWKLHMTGIKEMVRLRGGIHNVEASLQTKITRADVEGTSDTMTVPNLSVLPRSSPPIYSNLPESSFHPSQERILDILSHGRISPQFQSIFLALHRLTYTLYHAISYQDIIIDPRSLDEDVVQIHHDIFTLLVPTVSLSESNSSNTTPTTDHDEASGLAALLYAKSLTRSIHDIPKHSRPIIQRLVSSLSRICENLGETSLSSPILLLWLHFMGGMSSCGEEAEFFADGLMRLIAMGPRNCDGTWRYYAWEDLKRGLAEILWFPSVHDEPGRRLLEMAKRRYWKWPRDGAVSRLER